MGPLLFFNCSCLAFFLFCFLEASSFLGFWFSLELLTLSVIPYFFFIGSGSSYRSLFQYIVISSLSSFFLVLGVMMVPYQGFLVGLGVLLKLGVFPFMGWAYEVVCFSGWGVIWFFSGLLKLPFVFVLYTSGFEDSLYFLFSLLCLAGLLILCLNLWGFTSDWKVLWCHLMLSGSITLVACCFYCSSVLVYCLYGVYFFWVTLVIFFLSYLSGRGGVNNGFVSFLYFFLLVSTPLSIALFYKLASVLALLSVPFFIFVGWCVYAVAEQLFLVFCVVSRNKVRSSLSVFSLV